MILGIKGTASEYNSCAMLQDDGHARVAKQRLFDRGRRWIAMVGGLDIRIEQLTDQRQAQNELVRQLLGASCAGLAPDVAWEMLTTEQQSPPYLLAQRELRLVQVQDDALPQAGRGACRGAEIHGVQDAAQIAEQASYRRARRQRLAPTLVEALLVEPA
jgi:hypothetical protein